MLNVLLVTEFYSVFSMYSDQEHFFWIDRCINGFWTQVNFEKPKTSHLSTGVIHICTFTA